MSATRACLESRSGKWAIRDCGSTNGTRVNGRRVEEATLSEGDLVELGRTVLRFRGAVTTPGAFEPPSFVDARTPKCTHMGLTGRGRVVVRLQA